MHDLIDTKGRAILGCRASLATGSAEWDRALEMPDEVLGSRDELGLPKQSETLTRDAGCGAADSIPELRPLQPMASPPRS